MALNNEPVKPTGEYLQMIRDAIRQIALGNVISRETGALRGTARITGYVAKIHDEEDDELFGTIDVQEFSHMAIEEEGDVKYGYHEGVQITAIQDDNSGYVIIPALHSEVLVSVDPASGVEYVTMFSHVQTIQLDSHEKITVGVKEREEYDAEDPESPDVHELEPTGVETKTTYLKDSITTEVHASKDSHATTQTITGEKVTLEVDDAATKIEADATHVNVTRDQGLVDVSSDAIETKVGSETVKVTSSGVEVGGGTMEEAVLGQKLMSVLSKLINYLSTTMTTTMLGPQPLILAGQIAALQNELKPFLSTHVKVQN